MGSLLILGAGAYGQLAKEIAELQGFGKIDFLDDNQPYSIGKMADYILLQDKFDASIVAIGDPNVRSNFLHSLKHPITLVHPSAVISKSAFIGNGAIIEAQTVVNSEARVGDGSFICAGAVVNHNASVGSCCQIDCNAVVASYACVPDKTLVSYCQVWQADL